MAAIPATAIARNEFFQQLKACCVPASQLAIKPPSDHATSKDLLRRLGQLFDVLSVQVQRDSTVMDEKLADYVFFPLSHVFRQQERQPVQVLEMALRCLTVLIVHGWKSKLSAELVKQLLVLLTFIIAGVPNKAQQAERPEETSLEAYRTLTALLQTAGSSALCASGLVEEDTVPALGHCVSVILDGVVDGSTADIISQALKALQALFVAVRDHSALASFLPGTVSALVKVLSAPSGKKRRVLVDSLQALHTVLVRVLGDLRTRSLTAKKASQEDDGEKGKLLTPAWLSATAAQIKLALSSVLKLRVYDEEEVQEALERLCIGLLDECHASLANCQSILVETAMILAPDLRETTLLETSLQDLVALYPELEEAVKTSVFNWITSLPRLMQSGDEKIKLQAIRKVLKGTEMVANLQIDSSTLQDSIATTLRDSVTSLSMSEKPGRVTVEPTLWHSMDMVTTIGTNAEFRPVLMSQESQVSTRKALKELLCRVGSPSQQTKLAREMLDSAQNSTGSSRVASCWLALELVKAVVDRSHAVDDFLDFSTLSTEDESHEQILDDLYEFSLTLLDSHTETSEVDWRLEALALEATALTASRAGEKFRPELIDVLYPITIFLGSPMPELREHAIVTLNSLVASCGYASVSALIVDNADYMVNSISLRLNTFDISPTSSRVLAMLVRLTGPRLIPFMDDVIVSIFAALDNYHGYPVLVDSLFGVLKEVVEQGVKSNKLLLDGRASGVVDHKKRRQKAPTVEELLDQAEDRQKRREIWEEEEAALELEAGQGHPTKPWGPGKDKGKGADGDDLEEGNGRMEEAEKPPKTPTYVMLEKIAYLTQHYLTSPTPALRKSLLDLLAKVSPALAADEDAYLPLVHAVWPVVVARLYDTEPFVAIAACDALCGICSAAGDFISSRIRTEWWSGLGSWCRGAKREAAKHVPRRLPTAHKGSSRVRRDNTTSGADILIPVRSGSRMERSLRMGGSLATSGASGGGGLGRFAQSAQVWDGVVRLLTAIVSYVHVEDKIFGEILDLLADLLPHNAEMREALEVVDEDAVRQTMQERSHAEGIPAMTVDSNPPAPDG